MFVLFFIPVNGLTWYQWKNTVYKVELRTTLSEPWKAEAKRNIYSSPSPAVLR